MNNFPLLLRLMTLLLVIISMPSRSAEFIQTNSGLIFNAQHQAVTVQAQMTGQVDSVNKQANLLLDINLDQDWKTYWRSPGEGGVAPSFDWKNKSTNINNINWFWPAPQRYPVLGVETLGYKDRLTLPLTLDLQDLNKLTQLKGRLTIASCTTICVLSDYDIDLAFYPTQLSVDDNIAFDYAQAKSAVPIVITQEQVQSGHDSAAISALKSHWDNAKQQLTVRIQGQFDWQNPDMFIDLQDEQLEGIFFSTAKIDIQQQQLTATFEAYSWGGEVDLSNTKIHATVVDNDISAELISITSSEAINAKTTDTNIFIMFLIALIGGLILNIMPCVLPVLGMKLSSVLGAQGIEKSQIRKQFLASSLGILTSFWLIALFLLTLKLSGQALGWGIQFQNPYFIVAMVIITALFSANMLGIFEIQLPSGMQTWLATKGDHSYLGHYLQGMFATLLATPCSAPFLGTAVAFALGASVAEMFIIFTALGLGMALPWLLIALFPKIALWLPKPGQWMGTIKLVFALLILLTSLWLISLLSSFIGTASAILIAAGLLITLLALVAKKHGKKVFLISLSSILIISAIGLLIASLSAKHWATPIADELQWQPLNTELLQSEVAAGKTVFVDVTADWCVTCKANKIGVLLQDPVYSALQSDDIVLMKGDWTVRSDTVTHYLQSYNRYGVPFNIVYGPAAPDGIELSTILTSSDVLEAISQAQGQ